MYKIRSFNDIVSFENEQCTCFGSPKLVQEQFLAKQKIFQPTPTPNNAQSKNNNSQLNPFKFTIKKSLKKQFLPLSQQTKNAKTHPQENALELITPEPTHKPREIRDFLSPQNKISYLNQKTFVIPEQAYNPFHAVKSPQKQIISCKNLQPAVPHSISPFTPPPPPQMSSIAAMQSPKKPIKIHYNAAAVQKSPLATEKSIQKRTFSPISGKSINREHYTVCSTIKPQRNRKEMLQKQEIDRSVSTKIISQVPLNQSVSPKDEVYKSCVKFATMKSIISPSKNKNQFAKPKIETTKSGIANMKSKNDTKKSVVETNRSRIEVKSLKDQKSSLKKMDDVVQIYSLPDSEERSDSDKESVVLGRLNEYGSMIDPQISRNSTIERFNQGKMTRFNSMTVNSGEDLKRLHDAQKQFTH